MQKTQHLRFDSYLDYRAKNLTGELLSHFRLAMNIYSFAGLAAADALIYFCETKKDLVKPIASFIQRDRNFFTLFSKAKNNFYYSLIYALVSIPICQQALVCSLYRTKVYRSIGLIDFIPSFEVMFNFSFRYFLLDNMRKAGNFSDEFILSVYSSLAQLPLPGRVDELPFDYIESLDRIIALSGKEGKREVLVDFENCVCLLDSLQIEIEQQLLPIIFIDKLAYPGNLLKLLRENQLKEFCGFTP